MGIEAGDVGHMWVLAAEFFFLLGEMFFFFLNQEKDMGFNLLWV